VRPFASRNQRTGRSASWSPFRQPNVSQVRFLIACYIRRGQRQQPGEPAPYEKPLERTPFILPFDSSHCIADSPPVPGSSIQGYRVWQGRLTRNITDKKLQYGGRRSYRRYCLPSQGLRAGNTFLKEEERSSVMATETGTPGTSVTKPSDVGLWRETRLLRARSRNGKRAIDHGN
jgi:hypothetical protein